MPNMVQKVTFLGHKHVKEDELQNITGVKPGMPLNPNLNHGGCQKILEKYEEHGPLLFHLPSVKGGELGDTESSTRSPKDAKVEGGRHPVHRQ